MVVPVEARRIGLPSNKYRKLGFYPSPHKIPVYLTYTDWQSKREMEKAEQFIARTGELPELADQKMTPAGAPSKDGVPEEEGGNRQFRRLAKKEKKKLKS